MQLDTRLPPLAFRTTTRPRARPRCYFARATRSGFLAATLRLHLGAGEEALLDDGVDAPIAVDHLRHAEIDGDRGQRDGFVLAEALGRHQEVPHLAERVAHRAVER